MFGVIEVFTFSRVALVSNQHIGRFEFFLYVRAFDQVKRQNRFCIAVVFVVLIAQRFRFKGHSIITAFHIARDVDVLTRSEKAVYGVTVYFRSD